MAEQSSPLAEESAHAASSSSWWQQLRASAKQAATQLLDPEVLALASEAASQVSELASQKAVVLEALAREKAQQVATIASEKAHQASDLLAPMATRAGELATSVGGQALESAQGLVDELAVRPVCQRTKSLSFSLRLVLWRQNPESRAALAMAASTAAGRLRGLLLSEDDADAALLAKAEGVTSDLVHFVGALDANVFMHAALELPPSHEPSARTPWQEDHIKAVLSRVQSLRFLHSKLVPDELSEARFWQTYFHLCQNLLSEASRREPPSESAAPLTPPHVQTVEHDPTAAKRDAEAVLSPVSAMAKEDEIASEAAPAVQEAQQTGDEESVEQFLARELGGDADDDEDELAHEDLEALMVASESEEE